MAEKLGNDDDSYSKTRSYLENIMSSAEEYEIRFQKETGMVPPKISPFLLRFAHREDYRNKYEGIKPFVQPTPMKTTVNHQAEVSFAPLNTLTRTKISDLRVNVRANGSYLLARTIEKPVVLVGIRTLIEDHTGNVFNFSLYHMFDPDSAARPEDVLPLGTVFIIKEPLLKTPLGGFHIIRCDSPTDIVFVDANHHLFEDISRISWVNEIEYDITPSVPSTAEEWKKLGNEKFQNNMFQEALGAYYMALKRSEIDNKEMLIILYSNISAVYLKVGSFESVLLYSRKVLDLNPKHVKALYRSGRAHYELRQYKEASQCFKIVLKLNPKNEESAIEFDKCSERFDEQKGNVNIYKLFLTNFHKPGTEIDCADFIGPVKVVDVPDKGRGVVATEYVRPGTLLCVSKALCVSFDDPAQGPTIAKEAGNNVRLNFKLLTKVAQKIAKNPNVFGSLIYQLSSGDYVVRKELFCDEKTKNEPVADIERIRKIVDTNCFELRSKDGPNGSALFHLPSYFNHSCLCNALWEYYNDVLVIHAVKPIEPGEEICITYHNNLDVYYKRESAISRRGFRCLCLLCKLDRDERQEILLRREQLIASSILFLVPIPVFSKLISEVESTYFESGRSQLKCCLLPLYLKLTAALLATEQLEPGKQTAEKALNAVGLCSKDLLNLIERDTPLPKQSLIHPQVCSVLEFIAVYYFKSGRRRDMQKWIKILFAFEQLCSGSNANVAKIKHLPLRVMLTTVNDD